MTTDIMTGLRENSEPNFATSVPVAINENDVQSYNSYVNKANTAYREYKNKSNNAENISVENEDDSHSNSSIGIIDLLQNRKTKHKISKNTIGIEDANSNNFKKRGHWIDYSVSSPVFRRFSISGTEEPGRFSRKRSISSSTTSRRVMSSGDQNVRYISNFHRSLKLLGLEPKDLGISNDTVDGSFNYSRPVRVEPTFSTRLTKRSFSLESLRNAIQDQIGDDKKTLKESLHRKTLSCAVYEEWYFQKQEAARKKIEAEEMEKQKKQENLEKTKEEKRLKTEENFIKWKEQKRKQKLQEEEKSKKSNTSDKERIINGLRRARSNQDEVFLLWKREKDKMTREKKSLKSEKESSDKKKKAAAQIAYSLWKKQADEIFKEKKENEDKMKQKEQEIKKKKQQEKKENAAAAFCAWKKKKNEELRKRMTENKLAEEEKKDEKLMQETERLYDADRAFEDWLSKTEERTNKQIEAIHRERQKIQHQVAWNPGGSVHW